MTTRNAAPDMPELLDSHGYLEIFMHCARCCGTWPPACLLCPSCHAFIHARGWDIVIGVDRHPWLIPPVSVDPARTPLPAFNRRTMVLDDRVVV